METLKFIFSDVWHWLGFMLILYIILHYFFLLINRILRNSNIRKHGYPPPHCDADGDFRVIEKYD